MNRTPQAILGKLTTQEKQRLSDRLAQLHAEQRRLRASLDAVMARVKRMEGEHRRRLGEGAKAAEIAALAAARDSDIKRRQALLEELEVLKHAERQLLQQLYACDGKIKALDRMQEKHVNRLKRNRERKEQQELADLLVHHRSQWG